MGSSRVASAHIVCELVGGDDALREGEYILPKVFMKNADCVLVQVSVRTSGL
jgi:hypothetical protein